MPISYQSFDRIFQMPTFLVVWSISLWNLLCLFGSLLFLSPFTRRCTKLEVLFWNRVNLFSRSVERIVEGKLSRERLPVALQASGPTISFASPWIGRTAVVILSLQQPFLLCPLHELDRVFKPFPFVCQFMKSLQRPNVLFLDFHPKICVLAETNYE